MDNNQSKLQRMAARDKSSLDSVYLNQDGGPGSGPRPGSGIGPKTQNAIQQYMNEVKGKGVSEAITKAAIEGIVKANLDK
jgi:hypothetical protein